VNDREQDFPFVLREVMAVLEPEYQGMIIGGVAVIAFGHSRSTTDIDATLRISAHELAVLMERFSGKGIVLRIPNALEFTQRTA
jgi:hypothetical protein